MNTQDFLYGAFIGVILGFAVWNGLNLFISSLFKEPCEHQNTFNFTDGKGKKTKHCLDCNKKLKTN